MKTYEKILLGSVCMLVIGMLAFSTIHARSQTACTSGSMMISGVSGNSSCGQIPGLTVGTTTTGSPGSSAAVTNSGTGVAPILNFTVPVGANGTTGATGSAGPTGTTGAAGAAGIACYNSSGVIMGCKQWVGTATVNSSGNWSVSVSSAGFSSVLWTQFSSLAPANGGSVNVSTGSCTTSTCSGTVTGSLNVLGILTLSLNNINGSTIAVQAVGN